MVLGDFKTPGLALLSHADSDLLMLSVAVASLPEGFLAVMGVNLQSIKTEDEMAILLERLSAVKAVIVRLLGKAGSVPGFTQLVDLAKEKDIALLVISGTGDLDPELACLSSVDPALTQEALIYFKAGGAENLAQLLCLLSDRILMTGYGFNSPRQLPDHGIYEPAFERPAADIDLPIVGITFYRAHWLSGNTQFVDALVAAVESRGMRALPVFTSTLRAQEDSDDPFPAALKLFRDDDRTLIDVLVNTTSFAMTEINSGGITLPTSAPGILERLDVPVLQAICANTSKMSWLDSTRGLSSLDTAMNVVIPEFDGRVITVPMSFKEKCHEIDAFRYGPVADRVERLAGLSAKISRLRRIKNQEKRVAFVLTNSNSKASQIGNAVGLDAPASLLKLLQRMQDEGYSIGPLPESGTKLIHDLIDRCSYDTTILSGDQCKKAIGLVFEQQYLSWFDQLPESLQAKMIEQWDQPPGGVYLHQDNLIIAGLQFGNVVVVLQPPRGYGMDLNAIYHAPDLPPTHHYYAVYRWLEEVFGADAIVHVGKHGTLEWLPGKGVGLSSECFPDAFLSDMPLFYPFILNDPGEGSQAKRRAHAVIVDHLMPAMTTAETYGVLAELVQLVDEYYQVELLDPSKLPLLQQQIWELITKANLDKDLELILGHDHDENDHDADEGHAHEAHDHEHDTSEHHQEDGDDHDHVWDDELAPHGVPKSLAEMNSVEVSHFIQDIDGYLCELGLAQIRSGLHILGQELENGALVDMLCSLTRLPNQDVASFTEEVARYFDLDFAFLRREPGKPLEHVSDKLKNVASRPMVTNSDAIEFIESVCKQIYASLAKSHFDSNMILPVVKAILQCESVSLELERTLQFVCSTLVVNLRRVGDEVDNLLHALSGGFVPPGPSGSPTRGMAHILPTGKNFYSVDPRALPSQSAWHVGRQLADEVLRRYLKETATYPESIGISVWGTSAMRTQGDDIAEILALLGVRPCWQPENRRVSGIEVIPLAELGRPRIDVTVRISGFFRDAFQHLIDLVDQAVVAVLKLDEPEEQNFVRKHFFRDVEKLISEGCSADDAKRLSAYRLFGSKPGSYGAGILPLITEGNWEDENDFAEAYVNWGGYAYSQTENGVEAKPAFRNRLSQVVVALHNQDNREHDIFDSDDYLQFHGGMIATIRSLSGKKPRHYFGDTHNPEMAVVRDLKAEALRVFRTRVVNPKWIESIQRHGYKGGLELTATVDYFFGYDATAEIMDDWMYEQLAQTYALDEKMREFLSENNPWAMNAIAERLLEATHRKMWKNPKDETIAQLQAIFLEGERQMEMRGEKPRSFEVRK